MKNCSYTIKEQEIESNFNGTHKVDSQKVCKYCDYSYLESKDEDCKFDPNNVKKDVKVGEDGKHKVELTYVCILCKESYVICEENKCEYSEPETKSVSNNDGTHDVTLTSSCKECKRVHIENKTENCDYLEATETEILSNNNGTHTVQKSYHCKSCEYKKVESQKESCQYEIIGYKETGINDTHMVQKDCTICHYETEEQGTCVPEGELKTIKYNSQIYDYYDCKFCGDWCLRVYHMIHRYGAWEYRGEDTHIRYCACVEARQEEEHSYQYEGAGTMICKECNATKEVVEHNHGYGVKDEMNLMDLIKNPAYTTGEILSNSQVANPNPAPDTWCSRYEFRCKTCSVKYYVCFSHKFVDGKCTRTKYCGGIEDPSSIKCIIEVIREIIENEPIENELEESKPEESKPEDKEEVEEQKEKELEEQKAKGLIAE